MNRRRVLIHLVSLTAVLLLVIIASAIGVHVYSKRARRAAAASAESGSHRPPSTIWNHAITGGGRLEVEERFVVTDEDYPTSTTPRKTSDLLKDSFGGSSTTSSALSRGGEADPVGEVRSGPVFTQNRPVFHKPSPKPKLVLKPPQSLLKKEEPPKKDDGPKEEGVTRVTQTVYGFLDFVTTIGNTVMVFTPQTKKVEAALAAEVKPTLSSEILAVTVKATETTSPPPPPTTEAPRQKEVEKTSSRQGKGLSLEERGPVIIEASEQDTASSFGQESLNIKEVTPSTPELHISSQVHVVASPNLESGEFIEDPTGGGEENGRQGDSSEEEDDNNQQSNNVQPPPPPPPPSSSKGFTLKLHKTPVLVTPAFSTPVVVTAQKVNLPPPPPPPPKPKAPEEPTGVINKIHETRVNDGKTTVLETKIVGTYIGTQYARVLDVTSTVLPSKIEPTKPILPPAQPSSSFFIVTAASAPTTPKPVPQPTGPSPHLEEQQEQQETLDESPDNEELSLTEDEVVSSSASPSPLPLEPTPTASEEQTRYVLPEKKPEKVYVSPVPNPNAYSRQPQLYVDINPAKSVDVIVTATPTRGKQFRLNNRFTSRLSKNQASSPGTDSNELTLPQETPAPPQQEDSGRRSRFGRNRGRPGSRQAAEEVAVPTVLVSATPTRRFKSGSGRTSQVIVSSFSSTGSGRSKEFKPNRGGFSTRSQAAVVVAPTSSSSIYRFKLNRPTGRWRFKPSPKPKVNIIKTKEEEEDVEEEQKEGKEQLPPTNSPVYLRGELDGEIQHPEETRTDSNELAQEIEPELAQQTLRVATVTPSEFSELDKYLEIATIKSPYVFQAGNVKNTRYITVTKTFTKENIQPTLASSVNEATLENILATKPPYEKILEGSSDVATLPVIVLGSDMATPPLETITQSFSTTQLMLKTSILPVLYDGVTTLYTLTQSYFVTRLVTAHKTVPPVELFQFVPTKSLTEFNTALQEAGSEHRDHLLGSESDDENDTNYEHILAPPDELTSVGSDFDPSAMMDDKMPKEIRQRIGKEQSLGPKTGDHLKSPTTSPANPFAQPPANSLSDSLAGLAGITPEQLAFIRYFTAQNQAQQQQPQIPQLPATPALLPQNPLFQNPLAAPQQPPLGQPAFSVTSSPVVFDTTATVVETKTLRLLFGAKPTHTLIYSTKVVPTRMTTFVTASVPVKPTAAIANPFLNALPFPLAYVG